jgi:hypothetical protein
VRGALALLGVALALGCAGAKRPGRVEALRLSQVSWQGDAARRASLRLCSEGLRADAARLSVPARSQYERAIQIDPTNPWAYLVLARHELAAGYADRALENLRQAETLLVGEGGLAPGVEPHLQGLRGAALRASGRGGARELERAARLAPDVWGDGRLDADELL